MNPRSHAAEHPAAGLFPGQLGGNRREERYDDPSFSQAFGPLQKLDFSVFVDPFDCGEHFDLCGCRIRSHAPAPILHLVIDRLLSRIIWNLLTSSEHMVTGIGAGRKEDWNLRRATGI
jgi:hypothetical protein